MRWLRYLRGAVLRKVEGVGEEQARWTPDGALIPLLGIVRHLTCVEWRWIDGGMLGEDVSRSDEEFHPGRNSPSTVPSPTTGTAQRPPRRPWRPSTR